MRQDKRLAGRLRIAKLRQQACVEDVDYRESPRSRPRHVQKLVEGEWIGAHDNLALIGPTGVGKSWLASALGHKACRDNRSVLYQRVPRLFEELALARGDGRHPRLLRNLGRADLLILDELGAGAARHDLLEILEERYGAAPRSSRPAASCRPAGTKSSAIPPTPMPSSIASFTTPTACELRRREHAADPSKAIEKRLTNHHCR